jgi:hypothetical protein
MWGCASSASAVSYSIASPPYPKDSRAAGACLADVCDLWHNPARAERLEGWGQAGRRAVTEPAEPAGLRGADCARMCQKAHALARSLSIPCLTMTARGARRRESGGGQTAVGAPQRCVSVRLLFVPAWLCGRYRR